MNALPEALEAGRVLLVDDDPQVLRSVERMLRRFGHRVDTAASVADARHRLAEQAYDLVITDLQLPDSSGLDLLAGIAERQPGTRTILMSGRAQAADAATAIEHGVDRLLLKPFQWQDLRAGVERALAERRAQARVDAERAEFVSLRDQREAESRAWILRSAHALAAAVEAKDPYTAGHAARVSAYARILARPFEEIDDARFRLAGDLHDVGKIGVPDVVLNKPGRLSDEEFELIRRHPITGAQILEPLIDDPLVIGVVRWHHERWDGRGYPDGLCGNEIPLPARILAVADTLDAMTSSRAYRAGLPWRVAADEIFRCAGAQFDPAAVDAFGECLAELEGLSGAFRQDPEGIRVSVPDPARRARTGSVG